MTIEIETGLGSPSAEAYISVSDADAYFALRGLTNWTLLTLSEREQAIRRGCDFIGRTYRGRWSGLRMNATQALDWPRSQVARMDYGGFYASDSIPVELRHANAEAAWRAAAGELIEDLEPTVASESVGPISVSYFQGATRERKFPAIERLLRPFLSGATTLKLVRA